jgi:hypothetical protein
MWMPATLVVLLVGCGAQLDDTTSAGAIPVDAPNPTPPSDSSNSVSVDAPIDAPACFNGRVVFLNFDGVSLAHAATDSTTNQATWIGVTTATVPAYKATATGRATLITNITSGVQTALAQYPITVVTQRPASGKYVMIVFGGQSSDVGTNYTYATGDHDCGDLVKNDVGWLSDAVPDTLVVPTAVGTIGWGLGLQGTTKTDDCMCGWANGCHPAGTTCTLHAAISTTTSSSPATTCAGLATQDEPAAFQSAFCQ